MKKINQSIILLLLLTLVFNGCKKDEEEDSEPQKAAGYRALSLTDNLTANMDGKDWQFKAGSCVRSTYSGVRYQFSLQDSLVNNDSCNVYWAGDNSSKVIFSFTEEQFKIAEYNMAALGPNMTLYIKENGEGVNYVATEGTMSITAIDTLGDYKFISGTLDAYLESDRYIKGSYTVKYCD